MRRTRHRRRFHTDRVVFARRARYWRESRPHRYIAGNDAEWHDKRLSYGHLSTFPHPWAHGGTCLLCHGEKHIEPRRTREKREWRRDWDL